MDDMQRSLLWADPRLSRFDPLPRILCYDDFSQGYNGYTALVGNYEDTLDTVLPGFRDMNQPMLSNGTHWDTGTHGAHHGGYALKVATRARTGSQNMALKRITFRKACPIQVETYFAFKPEATELRLSALDVRSVGIIFDLEDNEHRVMPHIRYLNAFDSQPQKKWQYKDTLEDARDIGGTGDTRSHHHFSPHGWKDIPGGEQELCYNEVATKYNWHYLRIGLDLRSMQITALQCNDHVFDVSTVKPMVMPAWPNLACMLNVCWIADTDVDKRAFLYLDSVLLSGDFVDA